jgi:hypothetical protein
LTCAVFPTVKLQAFFFAISGKAGAAVGDSEGGKDGRLVGALEGGEVGKMVLGVGDLEGGDVGALVVAKAEIL